MASTTIPISCTTTNISSTKSLSSPYPFSKQSSIYLNPKAPKRRAKVLCGASSKDANHQNPAPDNISQAKLDRRDVLLGLGGLYGAYNFASSDPLALASPVPAPDISKCGPATISFSTDKVPYSCCPPFSGTITEYKLPTFSKLNVRPAAHTIDDEYLEKYKTAVRKMKELPKDDPRNFYQQANVHCAYCNGAYQLAGNAYDVHFSWLFFPFHRWYLYFHERILQDLIKDPTFTIPYWNWDNPQGMFFPEIFDEKGSPLYNENRNQKHRGKDFAMDLAYSPDSGELDAKDYQIIINNLAIMYRQMLTNAPCPLLFFGNALRGQGYDTSRGAGTIENIPHNSVHRWVGDPRQTHNEDMGNFYSASKDTVFYSHHWNVDRMWAIWKTLGGKRKDITDPDWLDSEFLFYDENKNLVKVKVKNCLDHEKLGYTFQEMPILWRTFRPALKKTKKLRITQSTPAADVLPKTLDKIVTFEVTRPNTSRTKKEKEEKEELLNLSLKYDDTKYIRFDVFLNDDENLNALKLDRAEYASSFANLEHVHEGSDNTPKTATWSLPITELLEDLGLEDEKKITVTLVPKCGGNAMTVDSADITLVAC